MIDRAKIEKQLATLDAQEQAAKEQYRTIITEIHGAQRLCRHWLGEIDRAEDRAKSEVESINGAGVSPGEQA